MSYSQVKVIHTHEEKCSEVDPKREDKIFLKIFLTSECIWFPPDSSLKVYLGSLEFKQQRLTAIYLGQKEQGIFPNYRKVFNQNEGFLFPSGHSFPREDNQSQKPKFLWNTNGVKYSISFNWQGAPEHLCAGDCVTLLLSMLAEQWTIVAEVSKYKVKKPSCTSIKK